MSLLDVSPGMNTSCPFSHFSYDLISLCVTSPDPLLSWFVIVPVKVVTKMVPLLGISLA